MALQAQEYILPSTYFGHSVAMPGSVIPGEMQRMSVRKVNYPDFSREFEVKKAPEQVVRFPGMGETHGAGSSTIDKLKGMLGKGSAGGGGKEIAEVLAKLFGGGDQPKTAPGYEEVKENRAWRV